MAVALTHMSGRDNRRETRYAVDALCTIIVQAGPVMHCHNSQLLNISSKGALIGCHERLEIGAVIRLVIDDPPLDPLPAKVANVRKAGGYGHVIGLRLVGVEFPYAGFAILCKTMMHGGPRVLSAPKCFEVLGLAQTASLEEVKVTFRRLVRHVHPDRGGNLQSFIALKKAYDSAIEYIENPPRL